MDETCDFTSVFMRLADGENVRRKTWDKDSYIKVATPLPDPRMLVLTHIKAEVFLRGAMRIPYIVVVEHDKEKSAWICTSEDALAMDWVTV